MSVLQGLISGSLAGTVERAVRARAARGVSGPPPAAENLPVSKPLGESGAQARRAGRAERIIGQDVSIEVRIMPGGAPMAVAGSARTRFRGRDGRVSALEELAYVSALRRFLVTSAPGALGAGSQTIPPIARNTDSPLSALQVLADRRSAARLVPDPLSWLLHSSSPGTLGAATEALERISAALERLESAFASLADRGTFARFRAESSSSLFLEARVTGEARPGAHEVEVVREARGHTVRSGRMPDGPLGLSGTFTVNGTTVAAGPGDSLFDLAEAVNRGEDLDADGQLDPGEDLDADGRLDGGTAEHGVRASFSDGRITLRSLDVTAGEIKVTDDDGVLAAVGLIEVDGLGQIDFADEVAAPEEAAIRVDGREFTSGDGVFAAAIPGVELRVLGVADEKLRVTVGDRTAEIVSRVRGAVEEYNAAMRRTNAELLSTRGQLAGDPAATRVRAELARAVLAPVEGQPEELDEAREAGLERAARWRTNLTEEGLAAAAGRRTTPALRGVHGVVNAFNALYELGITAAEDDTLRLDGDRFASALAERPDAVAELFSRPAEERADASGALSGGIAVRVLERLRTALGESGLLELRRLALESLAEKDLGRQFAGALGVREQALPLLDLLPRVAG
ncbi:MAG: flagellar filament capping protein FliD [Planctomycetota bacterium]